MAAAPAFDVSNPKLPLDLGGKDFAKHKYAYYQWLREEAPVCRGKISVMKAYFLSRYDDCVVFVQDPRFVRNRTTATGGGRFPFPLPRSVAALAQSMITEDEPEHRRLRGLVQKAFTARALSDLENRIQELTHELLDEVEKQDRVDLKQAYGVPIPATVISEIMGISREEMPHFQNLMRVLSTGLSGWSILRTFVWDLRRAMHFMRELIARKRLEPGDDILTGLIHAEEEGERLSEDELVAMVFLLIIAGYETTVNLITNGTLTLLQHPDSVERLRAEPELWDSAVEEIVRYRGPIHSSKPQYATEDVEWRGVMIPKGSAVFPLYGAANHDPAAFENPEVFDIARAPNKHLGFGWGPHFCLGASLARMETRITLKTLLERNPKLRLAVPAEELRVQPAPGWHRYESLPVVLG